RLVPDPSRVRTGGAEEAAEAFLGRPIDREVEVHLPGRLDWRGADEVWDGAHNPAGLEYQSRQLPSRDWIVVASILADKDVPTMAAAGDKVSVLVFAVLVVLAIVGFAFAAGYLIGRIFL